ncbi:MAG: hypothetical protein RBT68_06195 [Spirochaetia bacterium]|jgi:hypothetical protein|nr:hypothetical protein [Spirochaetia bacterium]
MFEQMRGILKKKELDDDKKDVQFEKNDFLAIMIALSSYMIPVLAGFFLFIAIIVWVLF